MTLESFSLSAIKYILSIIKLYHCKASEKYIKIHILFQNMVLLCSYTNTKSPRHVQTKVVEIVL